MAAIQYKFMFFENRIFWNPGTILIQSGWNVIEFVAVVAPSCRILSQFWTPYFWKKCFQHFCRTLNFHYGFKGNSPRHMFVMTVGLFHDFINTCVFDVCVLHVKVHMLQKPWFQCVVFEIPNYNDGNMSCLFKTHFSKCNLFVAGARPKFQS